MENQHRKITGYRELTASEIDEMNRVKALAEKCREALDRLELLPDADKRSAALAKTNLQQGFMWAVRAIARPETF